MLSRAASAASKCVHVGPGGWCPNRRSIESIGSGSKWRFDGSVRVYEGAQGEGGGATTCGSVRDARGGTDVPKKFRRVPLGLPRAAVGGFVRSSAEGGGPVGSGAVMGACVGCLVHRTEVLGIWVHSGCLCVHAVSSSAVRYPALARCLLWCVHAHSAGCLCAPSGAPWGAMWH